MGAVCANCGKETGAFNAVKLCDSSMICDTCCQNVLYRVSDQVMSLRDFKENLKVINLNEFRLMYTNPQLIMEFDRNQQMLVSPFKRKKAQHEIQFFRKQFWVSYVRKYITTTVLAYPNGLDVTMVTTAINTKVKNYFIPIESILSYKLRIRILGYPIFLLTLVVCLYVLDIWALVLIALLFWWGYGYEIVIKTTQGETYRIPLKSKTKDIDKLFTIIDELKEVEKRNVKVGILNNGQRTFCTTCGKEIDFKENYCKQCGTKVRKNRGFCRACGRELGLDEKFCKHCGLKVE